MIEHQKMDLFIPFLQRLPPALLAHDPKLPTEPTRIKVFQGNAIHHDLQSSKRAVPSPKKKHPTTAAFVRISPFLLVYQC